MRFSFLSATLLSALVVAPLLAACGEDEAARPTLPTTEVAPAQPPEATPEAPAPPAVAPPAETSQPGLRLQMDPNVKAILVAGGLDPANLPPTLDGLERKQRGAIMKSFTYALGVGCNGCHATDATGKLNFDAKTDNKAIAEKMWTEFVAKLTTKDGAPVYCDTCHQGQREFLKRGDHEALADFMRVNFVQGLKQKSGKEQTCSSCHGSPFDPEFLESWAKTTDDAGAPAVPPQP